MPVMDALGPALEALAGLLADKALRPDPDRRDWSAAREKLDRLHGAAIDARDALPGGLATVEAPARLGAAVARMMGDAAAVLHHARHPQSGELLRAAEAVARGTPVEDLMVEAARDPDSFARLVWAEHLVEHKKLDRARAVARGLASRSTGIIGEIAGDLAEAPAPIDKAPSLFSLNGFGLRFYGRRDPRPDGTYIGTRYLTLLFLPVMPIDSWLVRDGHPSGWLFMGKDVLGPVARWWRRLTLAAVVLLVGLGIGNSVYNAPERRLARATAAAEQAAAERPGEAIAIWRGVARDFDDERLSLDAARRLLDLAAVRVDAPITVEDEAAIERVIDHHRALPPYAKSRTRANLAGYLVEWAVQLGDADEPAVQLSLRLAAHAATLVKGKPREEAEALRDARRMTLAERLAEDWPLDAIRAYAEVPRPAATRAALDLFDDLGPSRSIRAELAPAIEGLHPDLLEPAVWARLTEARHVVGQARTWSQEASRLTLLNDGADEALAAALAADPLDHALVATIAELALIRGDVPAARAGLEALGSVGRLTRRAQSTFARVMLAEGDVQGAERLLERQLADLLPRFEKARHVYFTAVSKLEEDWIAKANRGRLPRHVLNRIEGAAPEVQQQIFGEFLAEQMEKDPAVTAAATAYRALSDAVPLAVQLGGLKLQRANGSTGAERARLLAEAEKAYISIQAEAEGMPSFHLGLGQVYHRLGKAEEGEKEFAGLLAQDQPELWLAVVEAYRELGLTDRAREVAEPLVSKPAPIGPAAALKMALMAGDLDEKAQWLEKADGEDPFVRSELTSIEAERLMRDGDLAGADRKYVELAGFFEQTAKTSSASANNAALVYMRRYTATGDGDHLESAGRLMKQAVELAPDNGLTVSNLVDVLDQLAAYRLIERWIPLEGRSFDARTLDALLQGLLVGSEGEAVAAAVRQSADVRALLQFARQAQALAPSSAGNWAVEAEWRVCLRDWQGLHALAERVQAVEFRSASAEARREAWIAGDDDAAALTATNHLLETTTEQLAALPRGTAPRLRSALNYVLAQQYQTRAVVTGELADAERALAAIEAATAEGLAWHHMRSSILQTVALLRAAGTHPEVKTLWDRDLRRHGFIGVLHKAMADETIREALAAQPEMQAAARVLLPFAAVPYPRPSTWILARVAGNAKLAEATAGAFESTAARDRVRIEQRLDPYDPTPAATLALLDRGP